MTKTQADNTDERPCEVAIYRPGNEEEIVIEIKLPGDRKIYAAREALRVRLQEEEVTPSGAPPMTTLPVTVADPSPPPNHRLDGFHVHHRPRVGAPSGVDCRTLLDAVASWVEYGTGRSDLLALATDGALTVASEWDLESEAWGPWREFS